MKSITINQLAKMCKEQQKLGNGNKMVLMTSDDEANEYHCAWFGLSDGKDYAEYILQYQLRGCASDNVSDYCILA